MPWYSSYRKNKVTLLAIRIMTNERKNINVTINKHVRIYIINLLMICKLSIIGPSPIGCNKAAVNLYISAITAIFSAGNNAVNKMMMTPTIPTAFFNKSEADKTV